MISPILIAMIILICVFLDRVSDRFGIPVLLGFILLGIFFGSDGAVKIPFDNYSFAEQVCSIALIFIMFLGGLEQTGNMPDPRQEKPSYYRRSAY